MKIVRNQGFKKQGFQQVYDTIPKSKGWLIINYVINVTRTTMLRFYKGEKIQNDCTFNFTN